MKELINTKEYKLWIKDLKQKFQKAQIKASVKVNTTMLEFYWELGSSIVEKQKNAIWGTGFLKQLSSDLRKEFPEMTGFSHRNIKFIKQWYTFYINDSVKGKQAVSVLEEKIFQIPWGHNIVIIQKIKNIKEALFYVNETIKNGWSRAVLVHQIENKLYERQGKAINNFSKSLPKIQSDLAKEILKDPYNFDFLTLTKDYNERELELSLLDNITELQYLIAFEIKTDKLKPSYLGQLEFYLEALDRDIKKIIKVHTNKIIVYTLIKIS